MIAGTPSAVSYTHLDVYKRQLLNSRGYPTYTMLKRLMAGITTDTQKSAAVTPAASTRKRVSTVTVSYTHLDVYKRQGAKNAVSAMPVDER